MHDLITQEVQCPYCWEFFEILIDCSVRQQQYIEDCEVCCRPINFEVMVDENGTAHINAKHDNE